MEISDHIGTQTILLVANTPWHDGPQTWQFVYTLLRYLRLGTLSEPPEKDMKEQTNKEMVSDMYWVD